MMTQVIKRPVMQRQVIFFSPFLNNRYLEYDLVKQKKGDIHENWYF